MARSEFILFEQKMSALFDSSDQENAHSLGDDALRHLIDRLLAFVEIHESLSYDAKVLRRASPLTMEEVKLMRRGLALYDGMPKWYA